MMYPKHFNLNAQNTPVYIKPRLSRICKIFVLILLMVVFEGAVRKWISDAFTNPLVLMRDFLAVYGVFWAIKSGRFKFSGWAPQLLWLWTVIFLIWGVFQIIVGKNPISVFVIGSRFWLLYLWFAYAAAVSINRYDFIFIGKLIILLLLAMTPLAILQHFSPPDSFLNRQVDGDESAVFRVTADIVRTTGTFSFTVGFTTLLALATPFILALLASGGKLWNRKWMPKFCVLALAVATIVSGSRGAIIFFGAMFFVYVVISLLYSKRSRKGKSVTTILFVLSLITIVPKIFSRSTDANQERFEAAAEAENIYERIFIIFFGEPDVYTDLSLLGHGLGAGTNFVGKGVFLLAETEAARTVLEGGLLGLLFIGLKFLVVFVGLRKSLSIVKSSGDSLPLLLWITSGLALLTWSIVGQLTVNALGYLLVGLAIASLRLNSQNFLAK